MIQIPKCKRFSGYRPCAPYRFCGGISKDCLPFESQVLVLAPEKSSNVLNDSALISEIEAWHARAQIVAVVHPDDLRATASHPLVDLALPADFETVALLNVLRFDRIYAPGDDLFSRSIVLRSPSQSLAGGHSGPIFAMISGKVTDLPYGKSSSGQSGSILIINLDALGDVLMTTSILPALRRAWPDAAVDWLTEPYAVEVLRHNPYLQRVIPFVEESIPLVLGTPYDTLISVDKGRRSCAIAQLLKCPDKRGYGLNQFGQLTYFNSDAEYAYRLGIDDYEKFRVNRKTGGQLLAESMGLEYRRDPYILVLTNEEKKFIAAYRSANEITPDTLAVGINTGCSDAYPNKKLTIDQHVALIKKIGETSEGSVVLLLGGKQETARNLEIAGRCKAEGAKCRVIETPTTEGLRRGILYIAACDTLITGDTSALHIGIALGLFTISWYGTSCWTEIDLYDNGTKFYREDLDCSPCWKGTCTNINPEAGMPECRASVDLDKMAASVKRSGEQGAGSRWREARRTTK